MFLLEENKKMFSPDLLNMAYPSIFASQFSTGCLKGLCQSDIYEEMARSSRG